MEVRRGQVWWADLPEPAGSGPGYRRPVLVVQADAFNASLLRTVLVAAITGNLGRAAAPGNVLVPAKVSGLPRDSVVNITQVFALDRRFLAEYVSALPAGVLAAVDRGLRSVLQL